MSRNFVEIKPIGGQEEAQKNAERAELTQQLAAKLQELHLTDAGPLARARLQLDVAELLVALERKADAWTLAHEAFAVALERKADAWTLAHEAFAVALAHDAWRDAVEACDVMFQCGQADSAAALGMGVWLSVSFPVDPELTLAMLMHIVEETPDHSDHAALAAIAARYVVDLRADDERHESLAFLADAMIARVAERHGKVKDQQALDAWMDRLDLRDPQVFLPRLARVIDAIVGNAWWFDRDELRRKFD